MTLEEMLRDVHALREDLLGFERKYGVPTEVFYMAYQRGVEPPDSAWVLDWSEWAATYDILRERLTTYEQFVSQLLAKSELADFAHLIEKTARHESVILFG